MGRRPKVRPLHLVDPTYNPPEPVLCPGCGYPTYDLDSHECEVSNQFSVAALPHQKAVVPEPTPRGNYVKLHDTTDNLLKSAHAYRITKDWVMRDAMLADAERLKELCSALIYEVEGLK